ncbi:hypothetical protein BDV95DRAFT_579517 [Massariosphaeria phaeospora]|uniref:Uncharacterized protein n=1 Tax=Massariosphaeria phaeospora TaxID=100035 RepID=A0A7C8MBD1_9PLEO|nr:hypothetical protein BDV95DRAFT_579517 [Massariosphaeria phaeospora]
MDTLIFPPYINACHACRDHVFQRFIDSRDQHEASIRETSRTTIDGTRRLRGQQPYRLSQRAIQNRQNNHNIGRLCPCGKKPKQPLPPGEEYISYCMSCMGVKVYHANLPQNLTEAVVMGRTQTRTHKSRVHKAARSSRYRVNIERAWLEQDDLMGGWG